MYVAMLTFMCLIGNIKTPERFSDTSSATKITSSILLQCNHILLDSSWHFVLYLTTILETIIELFEHDV